MNLLHFDLQAGHDSAVPPRRLRLYNGVLANRHDKDPTTCVENEHPCGMGFSSA